MTTPAKVLAALFPAVPAIPLAEASEMFGTTQIHPLPPMSGLHYACLEWIGHILVNDEQRRPTMLEYASAFLLLRLPGPLAHRLVCAANGLELLASATLNLLEQIGYADLPRMAREVNAALTQALELAPKGGDTPDEQSPLAES